MYYEKPRTKEFLERQKNEEIIDETAEKLLLFFRGFSYKEITKIIRLVENKILDKCVFTDN